MTSPSRNAVTPEPAARWTRIKELFAAALERAPPSRAGFLAGACPDDAALRGEVDTLLAAHESAGRFLDSSPSARPIDGRTPANATPITLDHPTARDTADASTQPGAEGIDPAALKLVSWGLRFADDATEASYRVSHEQSAVPFARAGAIIAISGCVVTALASRMIIPGGLPAGSATSFVPFVTLWLAVLVLASRPRLVRWVPLANALAFAAGGFLVVGGFFWIFRVPEAANGWAAAAAMFALTIFRLRPLQGVVAVFPYLVFHQWLLVTAFTGGTLGLSRMVWYSLTPWIAFGVALLSNIATNRFTRLQYRQQGIIDIQRAALERLQAEARACEIQALHGELRRQVAERSRDLAESLLRLSDGSHAPARLVPGDIVEDRYRIIRMLGEGGMGEVHEVERLADYRRLALKVMTRAANRDGLVRFAREAQIAAQLDHPNVVAALDVGVTRSGTLFLVMQLVAGTTLAAQRHRYGDVRWAAPILLQIARALAAMHAHGIVHRDLKPANVLIDGSAVKVADFGIASLADVDTSQGRHGGLTRTGAVMGTPLYMAPELAQGARGAKPMADVFSLGVVAYELLANRLPFPSPVVLEALGGRALPALMPLAQAAPGTPAALAGFVDRCLSESPEARPTAEDLVQSLAAEV